MKRVSIIALIFFISIGIVGCTKKDYSNSSLEFKKEYESLNGVKNSTSKEHRTVNIDEDNPYIKVSQKEIVDKIENNETFYIYVGDSLCPWCRSVIEKSIEVAKLNNVDKIYYVDIWDDEGNEIFRDKYELQDGKPVKISDGTKYYNKILEYFDSVLSDYTLTGSDGEKVDVGEKRIYAPNFFFVKKGKVIKITDGISDKQKDSREKLSDEILSDEELLFKNFFNN